MTRYLFAFLLFGSFWTNLSFAQTSWENTYWPRPAYVPAYYGTSDYGSNRAGNAPYRVVYGSNYYATQDLRSHYTNSGSRYSNQSWRNPYANDAPRIYNADGEYRGRLSTNSYDPDSVSNPYGRYGSVYSSDSINNPYGAGNPYGESNPYGGGFYVVPSE